MKTTTSKVLMVAALILTVSAGYVLMNARTGSADIVDLTTVARGDDTAFIHALKALGHDRIDMYEMNGQTVYTSVRHERQRSPRRLLQEYQHAFVVHGVNDHAYYDLTSAPYEQRLKTGLKGGLVPFKIEERHVAMGGVVTPGRAQTDDALYDELAEMASQRENFTGHRVVEIMRPEGSNRTTVIATWADDFDFQAFQPGSEELTSRTYDEDIPSCPDCTRVHHLFHPRRAPVDAGVHVFTGTRSPSFYREWYRSNFEAEGWNVDETYEMTSTLKALHGPGMPNEWLTLSRRGWARTVAIYDLGDRNVGIHVHTEAVPE